MNTALLIARILAASSDEVVELILLLRKKDGTVAVMPILDEADEQFEANLEKIRKWKNDQA